MLEGPHVAKLYGVGKTLLGVAGKAWPAILLWLSGGCTIMAMASFPCPKKTPNPQDLCRLEVRMAVIFERCNHNSLVVARAPQVNELELVPGRG